MSYKIGPLERELSRRCFEARRMVGDAANAGDAKTAEYWKGLAEAYAEAARLAEDYGA